MIGRVIRSPADKIRTLFWLVAAVVELFTATRGVISSDHFAAWLFFPLGIFSLGMAAYSWFDGFGPLSDWLRKSPRRK